LRKKKKEGKMVFFFDSGAGGLPYFQYFHKRNPSEPVMYIADRAHFPYGVKTKEEITALLLNLAEKPVAFFQPKIAALVCNTATVSALPALREKFSAVSWVGTVPAIKPALLGSKSRCVGVLGTDRTIEDPSLTELAEQSGVDAKLIKLAAPDLVDFAEHGGADAPKPEKQRMILPYIEKFRENGADAVVLGCTHFLLLLDTFREIAAPDIMVYDSLEGVTRRIEVLLKSLKKFERTAGDLSSSLIEEIEKIEKMEKREKKGKILLSGNAPVEPLWKKRAVDFGMDICLLDEAVP
jgi:glutamate racemase